MLDILFRRKIVPPESEGRTVACFLRANCEPLPSRFRQGALIFLGGTVSWAPGMYGRGRPIELELPITVRGIRPVGGPGEWNIKRQLFEILEAENDAGLLEFAIPKRSTQLVAQFLVGRRSS